MLVNTLMAGLYLSTVTQFIFLYFLYDNKLNEQIFIVVLPVKSDGNSFKVFTYK